METLILLMGAGWIAILLLSVLLALGAITIAHYVNKYVEWLDKH